MPQYQSSSAGLARQAGPEFGTSQPLLVIYNYCYIFLFFLQLNKVYRPAIKINKKSAARYAKGEKE